MKKTKADLLIALQKIANLPLVQRKGKPDPMRRAKRLAMAALGAKPAAIAKAAGDL